MSVTPSHNQQVLAALFADEPSALVWATNDHLRITQLSGGVLSTLAMEFPDSVIGLPLELVFEQETISKSSLMNAHEFALGGALTSCQFEWRGWQFRGRVIPHRDDSGAPIGCLGFATLHATIDGLEEALDAAERRFETLVGMSPAGIFMTDETGRCTYVNQRWCEMAGVAAVDALGRSWERAVHPDDSNRVATRWRRAMESGGAWEHTVRLLSPQGATTWVLIQARPLGGGTETLCDGKEAVAGYVGIVIDITERKESERQLRESEKRFSRLLSAVTAYRYSVTLSDGVPVATEHSTGCEGTTGYLPEDYARDPNLWINMVHPDDRDLVREHIDRLLIGQSVPPLEHRIYHKNGSVVWVRGTIIPHVAGDGQLVRYDGLVEDITDRKRVERRLWQILESAPDAMVIADESGTILLANGQTHSLFGYAPQELENQPVEMLIPERFRSAHEDHRANYAASPELRVMTERPELHGRRKDGSEFAVEISLSPIEMDDEVLVCAGIRDITHRKEVEQALRWNLQSQSTLASLLKLSLEPVDLAEKMERSLDLLFTVPWVALESKGAIFLLPDGSDELTMVAQRGLSDTLLEQCQQVAMGCCLCGQAAEDRHTVFVDHVDARHELRYEGMCDHGHYCVPIVSGDTLFGVLNLYVALGHTRSDEQERFLEAAAHVLAGVITRSRAEESLRHSEERFDLAVRGTDAGIWDWNLLTNQVYFSPRWKRILGFSSSEISDDFSEWEQRIHPEDQARALATIEAYLAGEADNYELEHRLQHRDGSYRWILARGALVRGADGRPCRMVGSHLDITDLKVAEERLRYREGQLIAAQKIQQYLLPRQAPELPGFDVAGRVVPAQFAGGDYYDYLPLADGTMAIIVGDVSGHDVSAALVMASTSAHLRSFAEDHSSVQEILEHTNAILARETDDGRFVTLFVLQLDSARRTVRFANAGHPHAYVLGASGQLKTTLDSSAFPLSVLPDTDFPVSDPEELESGDLVLIITDGILEARSPDGSVFESDRLLEVVRRHQHCTAVAIIDAVQQAVAQFIGLAEAQDDLTFVVLKVE